MIMEETVDLWRLAVLDTSDNTEKNFLLKAPDHTKEGLIEILAEVHPEYNIIKIERK